MLKGNRRENKPSFEKAFVNLCVASGEFSEALAALAAVRGQ
jgi:hypothetical protein